MSLAFGIDLAEVPVNAANKRGETMPLLFVIALLLLFALWDVLHRYN